jgi:hypothetical protein
MENIRAEAAAAPAITARARKATEIVNFIWSRLFVFKWMVLIAFLPFMPPNIFAPDCRMRQKRNQYVLQIAAEHINDQFSTVPSNY